MSARPKHSKETTGDDQDEHDPTMRWGTEVAERLQRVARYSSLGLLSQADERRFQDVCEELHRLSDLIDQFDFTDQVSGE